MSDSGTVAAWEACQEIARWQTRAVIVVLGAMLGSAVLRSATGGLDVGPALVVALALGVAQAFVAWKLATALGSPPAWLMAVPALVPGLAGLLVLGYLSLRATRRLRASGLTVSLVGSRMGGVPQAGFRIAPGQPSGLVVPAVVAALALALGVGPLVLALKQG